MVKGLIICLAAQATHAHNAENHQCSKANVPMPHLKPFNLMHACSPHAANKISDSLGHIFLQLLGSLRKSTSGNRRLHAKTGGQCEELLAASESSSGSDKRWDC